MGGEIKFEDYSTRYREGLDLVVRNISLSIKAGEKVLVFVFCFLFFVFFFSVSFNVVHILLRFFVKFRF